MPLIEGLGDEVVETGIALSVVSIGVLIWFSVSTRPRLRRYITLTRTYSVFDRFLNSIQIYASSINGFIQNTLDWRRWFRTPTSSELEEEITSLSVTNSNELTEDEDSDLRIPFYLKYLNDSKRHVETTKTETVEHFKRRYLSEDMQANRRIRLIYNGRVLKDEETVYSSGIRANCVMHCLIFPHKPETSSTGQINSGENRANNDDGPTMVGDWDLTELFCILLVVSALTGWYCRFYYSFLFTELSTFMLFFFTLILFYTVFAIYNES